VGLQSTLQCASCPIAPFSCDLEDIDGGGVGGSEVVKPQPWCDLYFQKRRERCRECRECSSGVCMTQMSSDEGFRLAPHSLAPFIQPLRCQNVAAIFYFILLIAQTRRSHKSAIVTLRFNLFSATMPRGWLSSGSLTGRESA